VKGSGLCRRAEMCPWPLETEIAPAATCSQVALPSSKRTNKTAWPRSSTVAFPNRLVKLAPRFDRESNPPPLFPSSLVDDASRVLEPAEGAGIVHRCEAAQRAMAGTDWWRHGSLLRNLEQPVGM